MVEVPRCLLILTLLIYMLLSSCGGSGGGGGSGAGGSTTSQIGTLFGTDFSSSQSVYAMRIVSDGTIAPIPGSPFAADGPPVSVTVSASSNLLFVGCIKTSISGSLSIFNILPGGALSSAGPPITSNIVFPSTLSAPTAGNFLLVDNANSGLIFSVDKTTGSLTESSNLQAQGPSAFSPDGNFILSVSGDYLDSYSFNGNSGSTTLASSLFGFFETIPTQPIVHPSSKFVYVPYSGANIIPPPAPPGGIAGFALGADGTLTTLPGSPFASGTDFGSSAGTGFSVAVIDPAGAHLYAESQSEVYGFNIDQNLGELTPIAGASPFARGTFMTLAFDPSGRYLFVSQPGGVSVYSVGANGVPVIVPNSPFAMGGEITSLVAIP